MQSQILDKTVMCRIFETYSEEELKHWGILKYKTENVEISHLKRVFNLIKHITRKERKQELYFLSPEGKIASLLTDGITMRPNDIVKIEYTVTAYYEQGPDSVIIQHPYLGKISIAVYAIAS